MRYVLYWDASGDVDHRGGWVCRWERGPSERVFDVPLDTKNLSEALLEAARTFGIRPGDIAVEHPDGHTKDDNKP